MGMTSARAWLAARGLEDRIREFDVSSATVELAAQALGVPPRECVLFDDYLAACKAAKAAGMTVVGVWDEGFPGVRADMQEVCDQYIESFGELL